MGGIYADACGCMRMCAYVRRKYVRCGREMGTQRQMGAADGGQSRSGRWEPLTEDKAVVVDGSREG